MTTTTQAAPYLRTIHRGAAKVHRSTCRKALANESAEPTSDFTSGDPATCCKPRPLEAPDPGTPDVPTPAEPEIPDAPDDAVATPTYDPHPMRRAELAQEEGKAVRAAKRAGQPKPPTPNLDKVNQEYADGIDTKARKAMAREYEAQQGGATSDGKRRGKIPVQVRFVRNGEPMPDSQNKLASVAYYHTKDVVPDTPRCTTQHLRDLLAAEGVAEPEAAPWGPVTLPNGVVLEAVAL